MGFDGSTGVRENEYVTTFAEEAVKRECARGGKTGGLGYIAILPRVVELPCPSAPCDIDPSRQRGNPAKVYYGITVEFPFETPMVPQGQMMQRIIAALISKRHALLESPTGTGKSAALLCAALAWQRNELQKTGKAPQILYCARTHTQLAQMAKEVKASPYRPTIATLGSRSRLCVNPMVIGDDAAAAKDDADEDEDSASNRYGGSFAGTQGSWVGPQGGGAGAQGSVGGSGGRQRSARGRARRRSSNSILESCQNLQGKVETQRKARKGLRLPGGGKVPYDKDAPDLTMDLAGIAGSLTEEEMYHVGCPYYRSMSVPEYAELVHEVTRPTVGLADGGDGEVPRLLTEASFLRQETTR
eukprot:jgi/Undpi1/1435/HiC_scaffold_11.g04826.m1